MMKSKIVIPSFRCHDYTEGMKMKRSALALAALLSIAASPALAHTGVGSISGFSAGFGHPIGGLDHVLAMVAVGILAAQMGGRYVWMIPVAFVGMMIVGGVLGVAGVPVPFVEQGIIGSVIILGAVIALGRRLPMAVAVTLVGVFAIFHGHAHGAEMPANASGLEYGLGFAVATALLHSVGIGLGVGAQKASEKLAPIAVRIGGGAIAAVGLALVVA
jgi:urease accessory protein